MLVRFNPHKSYFADGYKLTFTGMWKLTFKHMNIMSEKEERFWEIISMYDFRPFEIIDTIGDDSRPSDWLPPEENTNFTPSLGRDYGFGETINRLFPIWEWNEYVPEYMELYKIG